jgi:hypothetical protein
MLSRTRIVRAAAIVVLLMSTVSGSAFAAKADDGGPVYFCISVLGHPVCVLIK